MTEPRTPLSEEVAEKEARRLIRDAYQPTVVRVDDPSIPSFKDGPRVGTTPPVDQPGRPSMSPRATDASVMMVAAGFLSLCLGGAVSAVLYFSGTANETVVIAVCVAPPAALLALKSLIKGAKRAAVPDVHVNNYGGPVYQDQRQTRAKNVGVWVKNNNQQ